MPHPVIMVDRHLRIEFVNDNAEQFLAASSAMLMGQPLSNVVPFGSPVLALTEQVLADGVSVNEYGVEIEHQERAIVLPIFRSRPLLNFRATFFSILQVRTMARIRWTASLRTCCTFRDWHGSHSGA